MTTTPVPVLPDGSPAARRGLWNRQLSHYPDTGLRYLYLAITVLSTVVLYYELYVSGSVATQIITELGMSFSYFVWISVAGNAVGAFASLFAGLADRWGRANLVVGGLLATGLIILVGLPHAPNGVAYLVLYVLLSFVEGVVLVATPALIRDFSPQVGRGAAMGFWTLGPVLGSLVVTTVSSNTLDQHPNWRFQFHVCGVVGLVVFVAALLGLRELSPALRDQLMVSMRDRALVEARAKDAGSASEPGGAWRQMLSLGIVGPAVAISVFLLLYYALVGFAVVYFATTFGYSDQRANALVNWYWAFNAISLVVFGLLSDKLRVRKPFMVLGGLISVVGTVLFAVAATRPDTGYYDFALYFVLGSVGGGMAYVAWMASFTETVEKRNPAATAVGLAVWGWTLRLVVTLSLVVLTFIVPATSTLVEKGARITAVQQEHPRQFAIVTGIDSALAARVRQDPADRDALAELLGQVATAEGAGPVQIHRAQSVVRGGQLAAAQAVAPATLAAIQADPRDTAAQADAVKQIMAGLGVDRAAAVKLLAGLDDPGTRQGLRLAVRCAADLKAAPAAIGKSDMAYLTAHGAEVAKAARDNPRQWQTWWWVCVAGQLLFLPCVFLMAGRWNPRRAREDERAHDALVDRELAALTES
ncbi:MFS transporter [Streptomyces sp. NPDC090075]|uniref:MFS transporter n=1 Tax=Streptomyces sp. NPDC090075 TaxID=3365937 RepID=UPI00382EE607